MLSELGEQDHASQGNNMNVDWLAGQTVGPGGKTNGRRIGKKGEM